MELKPAQDAKIILTQNEVRTLFDEHEQFPDLAHEVARKFDASLYPDKTQALTETVEFLKLHWIHLLGEEALDMPKPSLQALLSRISDNSPADFDDIAELYTSWDWPIEETFREFPMTMAPQIGKFCLLLLSREKNNVIQYKDEQCIANENLAIFISQYPNKGFMERFMPYFSSVYAARRGFSWRQNFSDRMLETSLKDYREYRNTFIGLMQVLPEEVQVEFSIDIPENPLINL